MEKVGVRISAVKKIIAEETDSKIQAWRSSLRSMALEDEFCEMVRLHKARFEAVPATYEAINNWLLENRRISLKEWAESL